MPTATITSKGQVTVPAEVRRRLRLRTGDVLDFEITPEGEVRLQAARNDVRELEGILRAPKRRPVSLQAMRRAISRRGPT
jgi:AbrB family looped-hinge helix DNA binding protein